MAVHGNDSSSTTQAGPAAPGGPTPVNQTTTAQAPGFSSGDNALFNLLNTLGAGQAVGPDIEKYIEQIRAHFPKEEPGRNAVIVRRLSEPNGAHVFSLQNSCIVLLFDSLLTRDVQNFLPSSDYGVMLNKAFRREIPDGELLNFIVVMPEDYTRFTQMARYILVSLAVATSQKVRDNTVKIMQGNEFVIDNDVQAARNYIEQHNPHSVQPRIDIGFVIYAKARRQSSPLAIGGMEESRPIAAVGAYTEVWQRPKDYNIRYGEQPKNFGSVIHITNITSDMPLPGILPMCLAVAADQFIDQRSWIAPYASFQKGKPNLGNLSPDPNDPNKMWFANTLDELRVWIATNMLPRPFLAVDVSEGMARIPALAVYGATEYQQNIITQVTSFFGNLPLNPQLVPCKIWSTNFTGVYGDVRSRLMDSRELDYLNLVATTGTQDLAGQALMQNYDEPVFRARVVADKSGNTFKSIWRTVSSVIDPVLLMTIAQEIHKHVRINGPQRTDRIINQPWTDEMERRYAESNFTTSTDSRQSYVYNGNMYSV